jgi:pyruvate/2-oxoglutarate dehydrogenase complex dihydrolipoamide acyltransferase (E2) component
MVEFKMPKLGHLMEEGTVDRWHKQAGDSVARGEALVDIQNDKAVVEVESPADGILAQILVEVDQTVPVGATLALINT